MVRRIRKWLAWRGNCKQRPRQSLRQISAQSAEGIPDPARPAILGFRGRVDAGDNTAPGEGQQFVGVNGP